MHRKNTQQQNGREKKRTGSNHATSWQMIIMLLPLSEIIGIVLIRLLMDGFRSRRFANGVNHFVIRYISVPLGLFIHLERAHAHSTLNLQAKLGITLKSTDSNVCIRTSKFGFIARQFFFILTSSRF